MSVVVVLDGKCSGLDERLAFPEAAFELKAVTARIQKNDFRICLVRHRKEFHIAACRSCS